MKNALTLSPQPCRGPSLIGNSPPLHTFIGICLGPYDGPRGGGCFLSTRYPCRTRDSGLRGYLAQKKVPLWDQGLGTPITPDLPSNVRPLNIDRQALGVQENVFIDQF